MRVGDHIAEALTRARPGATSRRRATRAIELAPRGQDHRSGEARRRLPASAVRRHAAARHDRGRAGLPAAARHRRRADDRARRHGPGADPGTAARDEDASSICRCCSSRTTSASSPRPPIAWPSCMPAASSSRARCARSSAIRCIRTRKGCSPRFRAVTRQPSACHRGHGAEPGGAATGMHVRAALSVSDGGVHDGGAGAGRDRERARRSLLSSLGSCGGARRRWGPCQRREGPTREGQPEGWPFNRRLTAATCHWSRSGISPSTSTRGGGFLRQKSVVRAVDDVSFCDRGG